MERLVRFPVKTILTVLGLIVAVWALLQVLILDFLRARRERAIKTPATS